MSRMIYDNDNYLDRTHNFDFALYVKKIGSYPMIYDYYNSFEDVKLDLDKRIKRHERYNQVYYVDNDFYNNYYRCNSGGAYYQVLKRPVSDWELYDINKETNYGLLNDNREGETEEKNNLIYFTNFS